ncbi:MAG: cation transporter [Actinomycetia bacterium]|nr:cation transporter [Actinomycetes bacterium]
MTIDATLAVEGMSCSGCENNVRFALTAFGGVEEVDADHRADTVRVVYDSSLVDEVTLKAAIDAMGYTTTP